MKEFNPYDKPASTITSKGSVTFAEYNLHKVSVRWRKSSATWVAYLGGAVLESGFGSADAARRWLEQFHPQLAKRADYTRA